LIFDYQPSQSSWVALRIFASSHTNPIFVIVEDQPIRASKESAQWCLSAVDVCWQSKLGGMRPEERAAAEQAYQHARDAYQRILNETVSD